MMQQRIHKSAGWNPLVQPNTVQWAAPSFISQSHPNEERSPTHQNSPQQGFQSHPSLLNSNFTAIPVHAPEEQAAMLPIQPKLTLGQANDRYEQEADRVAAQVVNQIHASYSSPGEKTVQRQDSREGENPIQMRAGGLGSSARVITPELEAGIGRSRHHGQPLSAPIRKPMEHSLGADLSRVNIHTDTQADHLSRSLQAEAFTTGRDIFFRQGAYRPETKEGQQLIAHELAHVVQQTGSTTTESHTSAHGIQRKIMVDKQELDIKKAHSNRPEVMQLINQWHTAKGINPQGVMDDIKYEFKDLADLLKYAGQVATSRKNYESEKLPDSNDITAVNAYIAHQIAPGKPRQVSYTNVQTWADDYFKGVEYQNNSTGGWHMNRNGWLPEGDGQATAAQEPTRYVEFRRPNSIGENERTKLERCIVDFIDGRCWPNAHYDGGYVEITNLSNDIKKKLYTLTINSGNGFKEAFLAAANVPNETNKNKHLRVLQQMQQDYKKKPDNNEDSN